MKNFCKQTILQVMKRLFWFPRHCKPYNPFLCNFRVATTRIHCIVSTRSMAYFDCRYWLTCLFQSQGKRSFLNLHIHIHVYINKGCNFIITIVHSAFAKKSLSKSFFGLQPSGFRLSQAKTFFYWSHSNFLQYKLQNLEAQKIIILEKIEGDRIFSVIEDIEEIR